MALHQIILFAFFTHWFLGCELQAQTTQNNLAMVQVIYNAIQKERTSTINADLIPSIMGLHDSGETFDRQTLTLPAILKNKWQQVTVINLHLQEMDGGVVIAKGEFTGRQATECDFKTSLFHHVWTVKNGKIIEFKNEHIK